MSDEAAPVPGLVLVNKAWVDSLVTHVDEVERQNSDLQAANNGYLERARKAEARVSLEWDGVATERDALRKENAGLLERIALLNATIEFWRKEHAADSKRIERLDAKVKRWREEFDRIC